MIDQVPGYPRREEAPAPVSSQAGVASLNAGPAWRERFGLTRPAVPCACGRGYAAYKTARGTMCAPCANEEDWFSDD